MNAPRIPTVLLALIALVVPLPSAGTAQTLTADVGQVVVPWGGTQTLTLDAGGGNASKLYLLLGSTSGTTPGQPVNGQLLPLNYDTYFLHTLLHTNSPPLGNSFGILSSSSPGPGGMATATFTLPPGLGPTVVGLTLHHAFVVFEWSTGAVSLASNAVPVDLVAPLPPIGMAYIPAGTFVMGDHQGVGEADELPLHTVTLDSFYMDVSETTNESYADYLNSAKAQGLITVSSGVVYKAGSSTAYSDTTSSSSYSRIVWNGSSFSVLAGKLDHPMCMVSWYGAVAFANWRSSQDGLTPCYDLSTWTCNFSANGYRLPTEAEWEYAARGGQHSPYYAYPWGNTLYGHNANFWQSGDPYETGSQPYSTPVGYYDGGQSPSGSDMANGYGLYDMAGNVWEWCGDWYGSSYYVSSPSKSPPGPSSGSTRVIRSGSWVFGAIYLRCANRSNSYPDGRGPRSPLKNGHFESRG